jgi:glycosyltransferase involved in cell wall biosynthesis
VRLAALVESLNHVCCRYRLDAFRPRLAERGHSLELRPLPRSWWQRLAVGKELADADALILQRKLLSGLETSLLRRRARRLIFDFDDAVWLRDSYSAKGHHDRRRLKRFANILRQCDVVVAGNSFLADGAARCTGHGSIHIIPTCVDVERYPISAHDRQPGHATLVWIGSSSTLRGLRSIEPLLERIGAANGGLELKLICDRFLTLRHLKVSACPWSEPREKEEIASSDIGISWVPDDVWSRGKCGLKVLQYMAAGLPVVANPVGVQASMVRQGETGFLARTEREWLDAIQTLANEPDLRRTMGQAGRRLVEERYSVAAGAELWASLASDLSRERLTA